MRGANGTTTAPDRRLGGALLGVLVPRLLTVASAPYSAFRADAVIDRVAFFNERVDIVVDGARGERPATEFAKSGRQDGTKR